MSNNLHILLHEIGNALNDYLAPKTGKPLTPERIARLLFRIEDLSNPAENIVTSILGSRRRLVSLEKVLTHKLRSENGEKDFHETYRSHVIDSPEVYQCSLGNLNHTIKEVLDSSQPIEEEMLKLRENFETHLVMLNEDPSNSSSKDKEFDVGILLRMVMESNCLDVEK